MSLFRLIVPLVALALAGCSRDNDGALEVVFIDSAENLFETGLRLSSGAQHVRAATESGLVALNAEGEVVPALADRWIVTDDGSSFIFRLRDGTWPDGSELTAESVRAELRSAIRALRGTSLGLDLAPIEEVRAMAGRVVEIRLSSPVPMLLQILAQPELALSRGEGGSGPMTIERDGERATLEMKPPEERGIPTERNWERRIRPLEIRAADAAEAIELFNAGHLDLVLGGGIDALPLADMGPLSRGTVRIDAAIGLFGLQVRNANGLLATAQGREAIAMAIDRPALIEPFNIGGWIATTRLVTPGLPGDPGYVAERWTTQTLADVRDEAARRVTAWRAANEGAEARLSLFLPRGPGFDILFRELSAHLNSVGIRLERVAASDDADLMLIDRVARYADARWYLNQFHCSLKAGLCSSEADALVRDSIVQTDPAAKASLLAQAEIELTRANVFVPIGTPVRFSLVRGQVAGFVGNAWAFHPLPPLAVIPR